MSDPALIEALRGALAASPALGALSAAPLAPLPGRGIAHAHFVAEGVRLDGLEPVLRVPRVSQWGLAPDRQLAYEAAAFVRAAPSGATPRLLGTVPPAPSLPFGALVVERVAGAKPRLPRDLPALAVALAAIHLLPLPPPTARAPLLVHDDPIAETVKAVREQAAYLQEARMSAAAEAAVRAELAATESEASTTRPRAVLTLTGSDTHPGNFLIPRDGRAVFVDLEKALYGNPAIDLAHATLYTSTMWDPDSAAALSPADIRAFHAAYFSAVGPDIAEAVKPWLRPLRRLVWLRTLTWCIRWRVLSRQGGGWSTALLAPDHAAHIERTVADYVDAARIASIRKDLNQEVGVFP